MKMLIWVQNRSNPAVPWQQQPLIVFRYIHFEIFFLHRFNFENETPTTNFDTFPAAILTVFQVRPPLPPAAALQWKHTRPFRL